MYFYVSNKTRSTIRQTLNANLVNIKQLSRPESRVFRETSLRGLKSFFKPAASLCPLWKFKRAEHSLLRSFNSLKTIPTSHQFKKQKELVCELRQPLSLDEWSSNDSPVRRACLALHVHFVLAWGETRKSE